jgi:hypothetical protein
MLPAAGIEAKCESPPRFLPLPAGPGTKRTCDTDGITAITGHNDDSMGKFSSSG